MICKIWPIKENKYTGITGALHDSNDYIEDERKTCIEIQELDNGYLVGANDISATLQYMENEDKVMKKYVTGVNCDPDLAIEQWMEVKERNLARVGKTLADDTCNHAFHLVQSFEDDPKLTPDLAHQCGIEFAKKLGYYQAIVCTHIPGPYEGSGAHIHNHILFNSHSYDPMKQFGKITKMKYNDCKETYQQLRDWNDDIAREHNLSIVKEPDNERSYSWYEWNLAKSGESWKEQVRLDIENTKSVTQNWDEFKKYMCAAGYALRKGKYITYTTPEGKKIRDNRLGREFTKESLDKYWIEKKKIYEEIQEEKTSKKSYSSDDYFFNPHKCSSRTKKPYAVHTHDKYGRRRSVIELSFMLAAVIIKNESDIYTPSTPLSTSNSPYYAKTDWKLQQMVDAVKTAREENISNSAEITIKLNEIGKKGNNLRNQYKRYENTYNKMERLGTAIESYLQVKDICEKIFALPDGDTKETTIEKYSEEISQYKAAKAIMYKYKVKTDEEVEDFITRYSTIKRNMENTRSKITEINQTYRKLKKLEYQSQLSQNDQFTFGPSYTPELHREILKPNTIEPQRT